MREPRYFFNAKEQALISIFFSFLKGRLNEKESIRWALEYHSYERVKRQALLELLDATNLGAVKQPYRFAWSLIEEYWSETQPPDINSGKEYTVKKRIDSGERSKPLIDLIILLVAPRIKIENHSQVYKAYQVINKRPTKVSDLFSISISSGNVIDPSFLSLDKMKLKDKQFLISLARGLEAAVNKGIDLSKRLNWGSSSWRLGGLHRVKYISNTKAGHDEPDKYHHGIAPAVKMLHGVMEILKDFESQFVISATKRWEGSEEGIYLRLWASLSVDSKVTPIAVVFTKLIDISNEVFWDISAFPEIAELRAVRFNELTTNQQSKIVNRIKRGPPTSFFPKTKTSQEIQSIKNYWSARELKRILNVGGVLNNDTTLALNKSLEIFPELKESNDLDEGFLDAPKAFWVKPNPDSLYDIIEGEKRLSSIEEALSSDRISYDNNPAERARDWLRSHRNCMLVIDDLYESQHSVQYPKLWDAFGWAHSPKLNKDSSEEDQKLEVSKVIPLISSLSVNTITLSIEGISHWFSSWEKYIDINDGYIAWYKIWPIAVKETNSLENPEGEIDLNTVAQSISNSSIRNLDTLNTPTGKLIGVFMSWCPNLEKIKHPFKKGPLRKLRSEIFKATKRSGLIAKYRFIEYLSYFYRADPSWTEKELIRPLIANDEESIVLWHAVGRQIQNKSVLDRIGNNMLEAVLDERISRETRNSLLASLVFDSLAAFYENRMPSVSNIELQQKLRSMEVELRSYAAGAIKTFLVSYEPDHKVDNEKKPSIIFTRSVSPFLLSVWPQERTLVAPSISKQLADIPVSSGDAFIDAVNTIKPFLVPFTCHSLIDFGIYGQGRTGLESIDTKEKGEALLELLDFTIGTGEGAVVPYDLSEGLDHIRNLNPKCASTHKFRRLAAASRRF